jgi:hypothetical protein
VNPAILRMAREFAPADVANSGGSRWLREAKEQGPMEPTGPCSLVPEEGLVNPGRTACGLRVRSVGCCKLTEIEGGSQSTESRGPHRTPCSLYRRRDL